MCGGSAWQQHLVNGLRGGHVHGSGVFVWGVGVPR